MIRHRPVPPPTFIFPVEDWKLVQRKFDMGLLDQTETIFSVSNGYLGIRGAFEEGRPAYQNGTFINGFYETWPIVYGEEAFGFAKTGQTIVNAPDAKVIRLYVDDEHFYLPNANLLDFERTLDMRAGTLDRTVLWQTPADKQVWIRSRRLVSFQDRHVAAVEYEVTILNAKAPVVLSSEVIDVQDHPSEADGDPRRFRGFRGRVLVPQKLHADGSRLVLGFKTRHSGLTIACAVDHVVEADCPYTTRTECGDDSGRFLVSLIATPGQTVRLTKFITYHTSSTREAAELCTLAEWTLDRVVGLGFGQLLADQRQHLDEFWARSDVEVESCLPRTQQYVRWNLFQLYQSAARVERTGIPAKGLTAQGYEGHYFWDIEIYALPFLLYTSPHIARNLLRFRYRILDKARERARDVNQEGALFPWRTISGEEASAYYAAGTAQYHINADIAYALRKYVEISGDHEFLYREGAEILVETARLWLSLGFFSEASRGRFCIHGVTGPDEYTTVVNNNTFTNLMARENLRYAAETVEMLQRDRPEYYEALVHKTRVNLSEVAQWRQAADRMLIPYHEGRGIHLQDENFLKLKPWDLARTPPEKFPLLLHYHPLVIYRHRVIKQADLVLAMLLLGEEFSLEQKRRNFDFYDPLTTGDSSLSACIQSIIAAEIGYTDKALEYFAYAAMVDLADTAGNVRDGCHIASIGGTWMALVYGFAGLRDYRGRISFDPRLDGEYIRRLKFPLTIHGQILDADFTAGAATYTLREGHGLTIYHCGSPVTLAPGRPVTLECRPPARLPGPPTHTPPDSPLPDPKSP